mgnify:CR=1 FL=1
MTVFVYDKTFEGLLTAVFDAYSRRSFPDLLLAEGEPFPLFYDEAVTICTDDARWIVSGKVCRSGFPLRLCL